VRLGWSIVRAAACSPDTTPVKKCGNYGYKSCELQKHGGGFCAVWFS